MTFLVIGSGMMGSALAYDLAHSPKVKKVILADFDLKRAKKTAAAIGNKAEPVRLDINDRAKLMEQIRKADTVCGATSYTHNLQLTEAAIEAGAHFCDLGGNMEVVRAQIALNKKAKKAGVCIIPNCGLAPGLAGILGAGGAGLFDSVTEIHLRVGGLPQHPQPPLNYQIVFSVEGLINEYIEPAEVIRNGKIMEVPSMCDVEEIEFPPPFGKLEAFNTSGGISTLAEMFKGKVDDLDYKTIRYKGHCEKIKMLLDLGFASSEPIMVGNSHSTARELFQELLKKRLPSTGPDLILLKVIVTGLQKNRKKTLIYEMIDYFDKKTKISAMMRTTSFPTSVIAQMITNGIIKERGVVMPEQCVPVDPLIEELKNKGIMIKTQWTDDQIGKVLRRNK
jgi:lysine 6-dehydrogenase